MKYAFLLFLALSTAAFASTQPEELKLRKDENGNQPMFGISFMLSSKLAFGSALWNGYDLLHGARLNSMKTAFFNTKTQTRITAWADYDGPPARYDGDMGMNIFLNDAEALAVYPALRDSVLVLSLNTEPNADGEYTATHFIDIAGLCKTNPELFNNTDTNQSGCP